MKKRLKLWSWLIGLTLALALLAAGVTTWAETRHAPGQAAQAALTSSQHVTVTRDEQGVFFIPAQPFAGFIFYPGALVPAEAYAPLLHALAEEGVLCAAADMPLNFAFLDMNAAEDITRAYPAVPRWAIGGHSLGGAMAASHAAGNPGEYDALVLLASYSTAAIPQEMDVLSIYGDADGVLSLDTYAECLGNLPAGMREVIIPGGNHAQFGDYGPQKGDIPASISPEEQIRQTVQAILALLEQE